MNQGDLDRRLLENFRAGLGRTALLELKEARTVAAVAEQYVYEAAHPAPDIADLVRESVKYGAEPIAAEAMMAVMAIRASRWFWRSVDAITVQSKLELVLAMAIRVCGEAIGDDEVINGFCDVRAGMHREERAYAPTQISLCHQHVMGPYHADLFVTGYDCGNRVDSVAVEVDGHDFHEKTKEQASRDKERDRAIQKFNCKVFRYSGADVFADPFRCALEIVNVSLGKLA